MKNKTALFITIPLLLLIIIIGSVAFLLTAKSNTENLVSYVLRVPTGSGVRSVASELEENNIIRNKTVFYYAARFSNFNLKAGQFEVTSDLNVFSLLEELSTSAGISIKVAIPEGYTVSKIASLLEKEGVITSALDFLNTSRDTGILQKHKIPGNSVEGYLFPDTYFFTPQMSSESVIDIMVSTFFERLESLGVVAEDPQALFSLLTLASIVEREYRVASEAPLMASVFSNRLRDNVGLESCATIVYILTEIQGKEHPSIITYDDLKIDNDYNTYKWAGLPPGPISNPGMVAIQAAANPPSTEYYYFRINDESLGTHDFTETLTEHAQAGLSFKK